MRIQFHLLPLFAVSLLVRAAPAPAPQGDGLIDLIDDLLPLPTPITDAPNCISRNLGSMPPLTIPSDLKSMTADIGATLEPCVRGGCDCIQFESPLECVAGLCVFV